MTDRVITSLTNDTVKAVRALHMRKEREATGAFLAEGLKFIGEALDQGRAPRMLLVGQDARPHPLLDRAKAETRKAGGEIVVDDRDVAIVDPHSFCVVEEADLPRRATILRKALGNGGP